MIDMLESVLRRPRTVLTLMLVIAIAGIMSYTSIPKEANPDIDVPVYFVSVTQQGISPEDAERLLVRPLETELRGLDGLKEIQATASEGYAGIMLEFEIDADKDATLADIRAEVDKARAKLPAEADEPIVTETNFALVPTITVTVSGSAPERTLYMHAKELQDEIETISSVLEANLKGQREEVLEVAIDLTALESYDITQQELLNSLALNNQLVPAGFLDTGDGRFGVKVPGLVESAEDVYALPLKQSGEGVVTLGDVAEIRRTFKDPTSFTRVNGEPAIAIEVIKRIGTNIIENNAAVRERVEAFTAEWPDAIQVNYLLDQSSFIHEVLGSLESSIMTAIALVMIVVLATLGLRSALLVGLAIPVSFMTGFLILGVVGMTVNMMVMFGLVLTVGMLVDGAIVMTEYADRKMAEGMPPQEAYIRAARLMFWPIVSSTATTLAAFLPMLLWPGVPGEFMSYLPIMVIVVLSASLLTAMVFLPVTGALSAQVARWVGDRGASALALAAVLGIVVYDALADTALPYATSIAALVACLAGAGMFVAARPLASRVRRWRASRATDADAETTRMLRADADLDPAKVPGFTGVYVRFLHGPTHGVLGGLIAAFVVVGLVAAAYASFIRNPTGMEFFVEEEPDQVVVLVSGRGNLSARQSLRLVSRVEDELLAIPGIKNVVTTAQASGAGTGGGGPTSGIQDLPADLIGQFNVELVTFGDRRSWSTIEDEIRVRTADLPGIVVEPRKLEGGPPQGKDVVLQISSTSYGAALSTTKRVRKAFEGEIAGLIDIEDTTPLPGLQFEFTIDREEAGRYNAAIVAVGNMVQLVTDGVMIGEYRPDDSDDEIEVRVRLPREERSLDRFDQLKLRTENGQVPITNFVDRKIVPKTGTITRIDGMYAMTAKANAAAGFDKADRQAAAAAWIEAQELPRGTTIAFAGSDEDEKETQAFLPLAGMGALFIMFIILVTQFNSFYQAFLTLLTVVMAVGGVLVGMVVMGQKFSMIMTGTGVVALAGIVVNNAIVLIDTFNRMRSEGVETRDAALKTAAQRMRPILLTTVTTIAGLIPMATQVNLNFFDQVVAVGGITSIWWVQLSTAIIFGLAFSTMLTLVLIPVLLAMPANVMALWRRERHEEERGEVLRPVPRPANDAAPHRVHDPREPVPVAAE